MIKSVVIVLASVFWLCASPADACSCMNSGPACQAFWKTSAVFDATVLSIEPIRREEVMGDRVIEITDHLVRLDVRQAWKGIGTGPAEVVTSGAESSCGFDFKVGRRYLIFTSQRATDSRVEGKQNALGPGDPTRAHREGSPSPDAARGSANC